MAIKPNKKGVVTGTKSNDKITWLNSSDWLKALVVNANSGNDVINFKKSKYKNKLNGENGNDSIYGGTNNDTINGGAGNDKIYAYNGNDLIYAGRENDTIHGGNGNDKIYAQYGKNKIYGEDGKDVIYGGTGADIIVGGKGNDLIYFKAGNNTAVFYKGDGADSVAKGKGSDILKFTNFKNTTKLSAGLIATKSGNNLFLSYTDVDSIKLYKYFTTGASVTKLAANDGSYITLAKFLKNTTVKVKGKGTISGTVYKDSIVGSAYDDIITADKGNDIIKGGKGQNSICFSVGDGQDVIYSGLGKDTLVFAKNTSVSTQHSGNDLVVYYGSGSDKVIIKNYNSQHSVQNIKIGAQNYAISDFEPVEINLSRGNSVMNFGINNLRELNVVLENPFGGENYSYTITTDHSQNINLSFLSNGRFRIDGDYLDIVSGLNQSDDIILWGSHNTVSTNDLNDIVRIGGAVDSGIEYLFQGNYNNIDTGIGDDYIVYFGDKNSINAGEGDDFSLAMGNSPLDSVNSAYVRDIDFNTENSLNGNIDWFNQGTEGGDCRLLSLIKSLSDSISEFGNKQYSDYVSILQNNDTYTITFNNYSNQEANQIEVNKSELAGFMHVNGDLDVVLTDLGLNKLIAQNQDHSQTSVMNARYNTLSDYFFGNEDITYINSSTTAEYSDKLTELWEAYCNNGITNITVGIFSSTNSELGIIGGHAYALNDLNDEYISLTNVWDTKDALNLDLETFSNMKTAVFVYGCDFYNEGIIVENNTGANLAAIKQDIAGWQTIGGSCEIQPSDMNNIAENTSLAINSIIKDEMFSQV